MRYAVIMAGGTGTRFWPESRKSLPKQLLQLGGDETLLEMTLRRIEPLIPPAQVLIVTGDVIAEKIAAAAKNVPKENVFAEPLRRNTAPCVALAAKVLHDRDPEAQIVVLAADHLIKREEYFRNIISAAFELTNKEKVLVTLGITPTYAETGYGYIESGTLAGNLGNLAYYQVAAFHEKPDVVTAQKYYSHGGFSWNSGMFVFKAADLLKASEKYLPNLYMALQEIDGKASAAEIKMAIDRIYPNLEAVSIDVGIMEKADNLVVFPADVGWSDVGSWTTLRQLFPTDENGNVGLGDNIALDSKNNTLFSREGLIVTLGVDDLIVVHTPTATLVARREHAQAIKQVFDELEKRGYEKYE